MAIPIVSSTRNLSGSALVVHDAVAALGVNGARPSVA
jgi:hypothetical protein